MPRSALAAILFAWRRRQGTRSTSAWLADEVVRAFGTWLSLLLHALAFLLWFVVRLDINLLTNVVSLEAIFLAILVLMSQNRAGDVAQAQADRIERMERHMDGLVSVDHDEHGRLLRELHSHITCEGHTTIGLSNALPASVPSDAEKTMNDPPTPLRRQNSTKARLRALRAEGEISP